MGSTPKSSKSWMTIFELKPMVSGIPHFKKPHIYIYGAALATTPPPPMGMGLQYPLVLLVPPPCGLWWSPPLWTVLVVCIYLSFYLSIFLCMYVCIHVCMYVYMYVCMVW